jgi:aminoglycoside phosphotransferase (APT) family kinase protein
VTLEDLLENGHGAPSLEYAYRLLAWRILATRGGSGLTARMSELAREARTLEEYEAARDRTLGPILDGLESAENRDP